MKAIVIEDTPESLPVIPKVVPATTRVQAETRKGEIRYHTRAYTVPADIVEPLSALADVGCYKCRSSGIKEFRANGTSARVCKCVLAKQAAADKPQD